MAQSFRHVLRGVDAAGVEAYVAAHRKRWWQGRHLAIRVRGDRIKAARPGSRTSQPPVLRGTVRPGPSGAVLEGTLHRGAIAAVHAVFLLAALMFAVIAGFALADDTSPGWLVAFAVVATVLLVAVWVGMVLAGRLARDAEAAELKGELDVFFGVRERR